VKCPNEYCDGQVNEFINSNGGGSRYCLDGCGFYEEFPDGTFKKRQPQEPQDPRRRKKGQRP
jgi:hypothetical protein